MGSSKDNLFIGKWIFLLPSIGVGKDEIHPLMITMNWMKSHSIEVCWGHVSGGYLNRSVRKCITFILTTQVSECRKDI